MNLNKGQATISLEIAAKTVLVTGANRGLGRALAEEALRRGAKRCMSRRVEPMVVLDDRVTPLTLDVTDPAQIQAAVDGIDSLDILINNAGVSVPDDLSRPLRVRAPPGGQPVRDPGCHPGLPAAADT